MAPQIKHQYGWRDTDGIGVYLYYGKPTDENEFYNDIISILKEQNFSIHKGIIELEKNCGNEYLEVDMNKPWEDILLYALKYHTFSIEIIHPIIGVLTFYVQKPDTSMNVADKHSYFYCPVGELGLTIGSGGYNDSDNKGLLRHGKMLIFLNAFQKKICHVIRTTFFSAILKEENDLLVEMPPYSNMNKPWERFYNDIKNYRFPHVGIATYWPSEYVKRIGLECIISLPHHKVELMENGGVYFQFPFEKYYEYRSTEAEKHLGIWWEDDITFNPLK